jgi:hypothetical protein
MNPNKVFIVTRPDGKTENVESVDFNVGPDGTLMFGALVQAGNGQIIFQTQRAIAPGTWADVRVSSITPASGMATPRLVS